MVGRDTLVWFCNRDTSMKDDLVLDKVTGAKIIVNSGKYIRMSPTQINQQLLILVRKIRDKDFHPSLVGSGSGAENTYADVVISALYRFHNNLRRQGGVGSRQSQNLCGATWDMGRELGVRATLGEEGGGLGWKKGQVQHS
ncbi:hypothetical protein RRG08_021758 [Elysia crispata]|uniref:Uncharacterized protein n=1 Tax=Elysia crispata TaxID=231223 RepID=A0AAE1DP88_9GAST|nr:hypothetical protein RRG08_021758 [Elysia crispata]